MIRNGRERIIIGDTLKNKSVPVASNGSFIFGHLSVFQKDPLGFMQNLSKEYGPIVRFRLGPFQKMILLSDPDLIKEVLVTKQKYFIKSKDVQLLKTVVGEGLLTSEKDLHMRQRRLLQPSFKKTHITSYAQDMIDIAEEYVSQWHNGTDTEITEDMMNITLAIITKTMFSMEYKEGSKRIGESVDKAMKLSIKKMRSLFPLPLWIPSKSNREIKKIIKKLDRELFEIINTRKRDSVQKEDLLGMLIRAKDDDHKTGMTDTQLRDELMTIFLAGHETTANGLAWTLYLLATHPEAEQKLHEELDSVIGEAHVKPEHFQRLTYTQNVVWESLRLFPPAYVIGRQVDKEVKIGNYPFQKGETVMMSQYVMHRNPKYFKDPESFIPERFENNFIKSLPEYAYFPFGGGPRVCIGNHFAFMEMVFVLACIASRFKLRLAPNQEQIRPQPLITLRPKTGIKMNLEKRI